MGIEEIKAKIIEDAEAEARRIVEHARTEAGAVLAAAEERGRAEAQRILSEAEIQATRLEERVRVEAALERQKARAELEKRLVDAVIENARARFFALPARELAETLIGAILTSGAQGTETIRFAPELKHLATKTFAGKLNRAAAERSVSHPAFAVEAEPASRGDIELHGNGYVIIVSVAEALADMDAGTRKRVVEILFGERGEA